MSTHESLVVNHSVRTSLAPAGARWYEIRNPNEFPTIFEQNAFTDRETSVWMASIAMDHAGDIGLGFSQSSSGIHPGISFTGRGPSDALKHRGAAGADCCRQWFTDRRKSPGRLSWLGD